MKFSEIYKQILKESTKELKIDKEVKDYLVYNKIFNTILKEEVDGSGALGGAVVGGALGGLAGLYGAGKIGHYLAKNYLDSRVKILKEKKKLAEEKGDLEKAEELDIEIRNLERANKTPKILAFLGSLFLLGIPLAKIGLVVGSIAGGLTSSGLEALKDKILYK